MRAPALQTPPGRSARLASAASRLQSSLQEPAFIAAAGHAPAVEKLQVACNVTRAMVTRYGARLEAPWSHALPAYEATLSNAADYAVVLAGPGRPSITSVEFRALDTIADQLLGAVTAVGGDLLIAGADGSEPLSDQQESGQLAQVAVAYREDASRERRMTLTCFLIFVLLILSSLGFILWGILRIGEQPTSRNVPGSSIWPVFSAHLVAALISLAAAGIMVIQAERHRRAAQEASRLERQFTAVESYLAPMSPVVRDIMRASLTPRLFSRILWDSDPMREPLWPSASDVAAASPSPRHRAPRNRPSPPGPDPGSARPDTAAPQPD